MNEFDMIAQYFAPLTLGRKEAAKLKDDGAVLGVPDGYELVVTSDTLNEDVHFLQGEKPKYVARKALRVNLSDLAAMGAKPLCYQLCVSFPQKPEAGWVEAFTGALLEDQERFGIFCSGGDTTSTKGGMLSISITAMGLVPKGKALWRKGARPGDAIVLTGPVGDAYLGLKVLKNNKDDNISLYAEAIGRYRAPWPRVEAVDPIRKYAVAACDISDGVLADLGHICAASQVGARVELFGMAYSKDVHHALHAGILMIEKILTGGDDYELVLAVPPENLGDLLNDLKKIDLNPFVAGSFQEKALGFQVFDTSGSEIGADGKGWQHF